MSKKIMSAWLILLASTALSASLAACRQIPEGGSSPPPFPAASPTFPLAASPIPSPTSTPTPTAAATATEVPLPSEVLSQIPADKQYKIVNGQVLVDGQVWFEMNSAGEWQETNAKLLADAVAEGYKPLDLEQFPVIRDFLAYTDTVCAPSHSLGDVPEGKLLEKAAGLPEGKLWEPEFFDYYVGTTNSFKCIVLLISSEPEFTKSWSGDDWGHWQGTVKIIFLTSLDGEAERFIYFPQPQE